MGLAGRAVEKAPRAPAHPVRTALCIEPRSDGLYLFLPPLPAGKAFLALVAELDAVWRESGLAVRLEGYPPPAGAGLYRFSVTPTPACSRSNLPPTETSADYAALIDTVFAAALHAGLHSEKYMVDGRLAGSGGGNHLTFGGTSPLQSPFVVRPISSPA